MVMGDHRSRARHAEIAWPVLLRLHADDDARSLRLYTAMAPLLEGDDEACERILDAVDARATRGRSGRGWSPLAARAELALARGEIADGPWLYDAAVASVRAGSPGTQAGGWARGCCSPRPARWLRTSGTARRPADRTRARTARPARQ